MKIPSRLVVSVNINAISWLWAPSSSPSTKQVSKVSFWSDPLENPNSGRKSFLIWLIISSSDWLRKKFSSFKISVIELQPKTIDVWMATSMRNKMTFCAMKSHLNYSLRSSNCGHWVNNLFKILNNEYHMDHMILSLFEMYRFSYKKAPCPWNFHSRLSRFHRLSVLYSSHLSDEIFSLLIK